MDHLDPISHVGQAIRAYRQRLGLSQSELASETGLDRKTVNRIERGHHSMRVSTLFDLAGALGVAPEDLLRGDEEEHGDDDNDNGGSLPPRQAKH